jgi:hypothetical protein
MFFPLILLYILFLYWKYIWINADLILLWIADAIVGITLVAILMRR